MEGVISMPQWEHCYSCGGEMKYHPNWIHPTVFSDPKPYCHKCYNRLKKEGKLLKGLGGRYHDIP